MNLPRKPRALAIDLDGTLLGPDDRVSPRNARALAAARAAGMHVIIATARWVQNAERVSSSLGLSEPVIACSGAQVRRPRERADLLDIRLPLAFATALYEVCDEIPCIVWAPEDERVLMKIEGSVELGDYAELVRVPSLRAARSGSPRMALIQGRRARARVQEVLEPEWGDRVRFVRSVTTQGHELLTLTANGADKGVALAAACRELDLEPREVVAFGDAENDLEMFARAGASYAMGQASDAVKAAASAVTASNGDDGVARAIEQLLRS